MRLRTRRVVGSLLSMIAISTVLQTGVSGATSNTEAASVEFAFQGKSPYTSDGDGDTCASSGGVSTRASAEIKRGGISYGTVELRFSSYCVTYWTRVTLKSNLGANYYANGYVKAYNNGLDEVGRFNCDSANGNGHIITGQRTCYTPMWEFTYKGMEGSSAEGYIYHKNASGVWELFAFGGTLVYTV